jgi:hypothetical protein
MPVDVFFEDRVHCVAVNVRRGSSDVAPATLVFSITRDGHSRELASRIGERLKAPVHEIQDLVRRKGFIGCLCGGRPGFHEDGRAHR